MNSKDVEVSNANGDSPKRVKKKIYEKELFRMQLELVKMQEWVKHNGLKVVVIFEGRDAAGKGGVIKRITQHLSPRICRVAALPAPTERQKTQWYFQRYCEHLPAAGEMVLFDRSWYNRAGVERVMNFCSDEEYREFMRSCPEFERMLVRSGMLVIKYWFPFPMKSRKNGFKVVCLNRTSAGSFRQWISNRALAGSSIQKRKMKCLRTLTSSRRRGMLSTRMINVMRG